MAVTTRVKIARELSVGERGFVPLESIQVYSFTEGGEWQTIHVLNPETEVHRSRLNETFVKLTREQAGLTAVLNNICLVPEYPPHIAMWMGERYKDWLPVKLVVPKIETQS